MDESKPDSDSGSKCGASIIATGRPPPSSAKESRDSPKFSTPSRVNPFIRTVRWLEWSIGDTARIREIFRPAATAPAAAAVRRTTVRVRRSHTPSAACMSVWLTELTGEGVRRDCLKYSTRPKRRCRVAGSGEPEGASVTTTAVHSSRMVPVDWLRPWSGGIPPTEVFFRFSVRISRARSCQFSRRFSWMVGEELAMEPMSEGSTATTPPLGLVSRCVWL